MVSLATSETVISVTRVWSPGKNIVVMFGIKYILCAYLASVAQLAEV